MKECCWCELNEGTLFREYNIANSGYFCEECVNKLDNWSEEDWDEFYDGLHEANLNHPFIDDSDY